MKERTYSISINDNVYLVKLVERKMKTIRLKVRDNVLIVSGHKINESRANELIFKNIDWVNKVLTNNATYSTSSTFMELQNFEVFYLLGNKVKIIKDNEYYYINNDKFKSPKTFDLIKEYRKLRKFYCYLIQDRVDKIKPLFNHECIVIYKDMKSRFGYNAYAKNLICLSTRLIHLPVHLIDYVIIHEFCHFKYHNHQKEFYQEVSKYYPLYKEARKELKNYSFIMK